MVQLSRSAALGELLLACNAFVRNVSTNCSDPRHRFSAPAAMGIRTWIRREMPTFRPRKFPARRGRSRQDQLGRLAYCEAAEIRCLTQSAVFSSNDSDTTLGGFGSMPAARLPNPRGRSTRWLTPKGAP